MKKLVLLLFSITIANALFAQKDHEKTIKRLDQLIEKELKMENVHNVFMSVYSPSNDFEWHTARGTFRDGREVTIEHPFYTASIGKTFTASAIGMLVDQEKIRFDDPIAIYLPDETMIGLHVLDGVDYGDSITVAHLLQHTSGLPDYFGDPVDGSPGIFDLIISEPDRCWKPDELIAFSKRHFKPVFAPGNGYYYTDTEYVLLGMIIERVSKMKLHEFFTRYIFQPLEMHHTYLNLRSEPNKSVPGMTEMYAGEYEVGSFRSLSADWAGGAIVSTGKDLIAFFSGLREGKLVSADTYKEMQQWIPETKGMSYGFGLRKISFKELSPLLPLWEAIGHSGLNGTSMYYCPELDIYLAGTLNQLEASKDAVILMAKVLMACKKL